MSTPTLRDLIAGATPRRKLIGVHLQFSRSNMETLESIVAMYEDSEDPQILRIATTARRRITNALNSTPQNES